MNAMSKSKPKAEKAVPEAEAMKPAEPAAEPQRPHSTERKSRGRMRVLLMAALPLALVIGGGYVWVTGGRYQETENAYLRQPKVTIASQASGRIIESHIADNGAVKKGDVLFVVDPEPYRIALDQADAALAAARLNVGQLRAAYSQALAQQKLATNDVAYQEGELKRQQSLASKGIATRAALDETTRNLTKARDTEAAARQAVTGALAALGSNPDIETDRHPAVLAALATRDNAAYQLAQTTVRAPADGVISQASSFQAGQLVAAGSALFSLVENGDNWVEANFKETQLTHMHPGQEAEIRFDTFPDKPMKAVVDSIGAGTGAEFSLIPAQNATGNWVKVTQRIPVRLKVEDLDAAMTLRTGMSATVEVDTEVTRGLPALFGAAFAGTAE